MDDIRRYEFDNTLKVLLDAVKDNNNVQQTMNNISTLLDEYPILDPVTSLPVTSKIDNYALQFVPTDAPDNLIPIECTANGNCLFNAISILLCGNDSMAGELRLRTAVALLQLQEEFTHPSSESVRQLIHEQSALYAPFGSIDQIVNKHHIIDGEIQIVFQTEVLTTLTNGAWSSMWQIMGLATALQMPIWSIYPDITRYRHRHLFNKMVLPLLTLNDSMFILPILWSGYLDNAGFHANHFVPLVPETFIGDNLLTNVQPNLDTNTYAIPRYSDITNNNVEDYVSHTKTTHNNILQQTFIQCISEYSDYCGCCNQRILAHSNIKSTVKYGKMCSVCYRYINDRGHSPIDKDYMYPGDIPSDIQSLNSTEIKFISQIHPYMKLVSLPAGGQHGLIGQSINIPVPTQTLCTSLPRNDDASHLVKVYSSKSDKYSEIVNVQKIDRCLKWLHVNNKLYNNISVSFTEDIAESTCNDKRNHGNDEDVEISEIGLIPIDYQLPKNSETICNFKLPIMKGEPINIFNSTNLEEYAFPNLYPYGTHGMKYERPLQPNVGQYLRCRILNQDRRWITSPQYIFWALHIYEQDRLQNVISTVLRKRTNTRNDILVEDIGNTVNIDAKSDNYMFMRQIRGTAAYWKNELSKLMAKIRTLGAPTFFMSLSANDINWEDNIKFIDPKLTDEEILNLSYSDKCRLVRDNPVLSAIHFNNRWESFLHNFLMIKPYPLGQITDYFARIEFQMRGSPHLHIFLWIADAPSYEKDNDNDHLIPFIDRYISACIPSDDEPDLQRLVKSLQIHKHTHTCQRTKGVKCRFDYPMPVSQSTRLKIETDTGSPARFYILKRNDDDIYVNAYNKDVLTQWRANMDIQLVGSMYAAAKYICTYICKNEPLQLRQSISQCLKNMPNDVSKRKLMSKIGNILLTHRTIGLQDAAYRLLSLNMVYSSRDTVYIDTSLPTKRYRILKSKKQLEQLPARSTDIYQDNNALYYTYRPNDEIFTHMCLAHFLTSYRQTNYTPVTERGLPRYNFVVKGQKKTFMKRSKVACLRYHIPNINLDEEAYYHALLYLFLPFRNETDIIAPYQTYQEAFYHKRHLMDQDQLKATNTTKKFETAVQHLLTLSQDNLDGIYAVTTPSYQQSLDELNKEGISEQNSVFMYDILNTAESHETTQERDFNVTMFKKLAENTMTDDEYKEKKMMLTQTQKVVFDHIQKHLVSKRNVMHLFITGGAGTGKSFLLQLIRESILRQNTHEYPNVLVAAPTGVAAYNINGHTLHTLLQLPTQDRSNARYSKLSPRSFKILSETFKYVDYLIIDEISMVSYNTLEHIHMRLNEIKGHHLDHDIYFGNINIITFGDLYQLRPVFGSTIYTDTIIDHSLHLWKDFFIMFELLENKRQSEDTEYAKLLNRIRTGDHTSDDIDSLMSRIIQTSNANVLQHLHIFPLKEMRDKHNERVVKNLCNNTDIHVIKAIHDVPDNCVPDDDQKCAGIPKITTLCVNARIMLIRNIDTRKGLVNGAQGTVHSIEWQNSTGKQSKFEIPRCVNVLFDDPNVFKHVGENVQKPIGICPLTVKFMGKENKYISRTQIPLILSFATTVHKVQGLTIKAAVCDIGPSIFTGGMAYVALSRVSKLSDLHLTKFCPPRVYPCKTVSNEMKRLRQKTQNMVQSQQL